MTKNDLKPGMIVETRDGDLYIVQNFVRELILVKGKGWNPLSDYSDDLIFIPANQEHTPHDIMKVRLPDRKHHFCENWWGEAHIIWERKEIKLTQEEKALIRLLDSQWKWICKDEDGSVYAYTETPQKKVNALKKVTAWNGFGDVKYLNNINSNLKFNFLSWEDQKPTSLDELRKLAEEE